MYLPAAEYHEEKIDESANYKLDGNKVWADINRQCL